MEYSTSFKENAENVIKRNFESDLLKERLNAKLGLKVLDCDEENHTWMDFLFEPEELHLNQYDGIHGGITCSVLDACCGIAVWADKKTLPSTTDMSVSFIKPMPRGKYRIHVDLTSKGNRLAGGVGTIINMETEEVCATGMMKYYVSNSIPIIH